MNWSELAGQWRDLAISGIEIGAAIVAGYIVYFVIRLVLRVVARRRKDVVLESFRKHSKRPLRLALPVIAVMIALPFAPLPDQLHQLARQITSILLIVSIAWILIKAADVFQDYLQHRFSMDNEDNLQARKIVTQVQIFKRIFTVVVIVLAAALALLNFEKVRQLGTTILASAGIIGVVLGFASQRSIALIFAGLQVAFTQPIRIDDVVIVDGEWGRIEEISLTYVIVRIWDLRRLVVPISYFIEKPFQNWTRASSDLLGTVFLYADYTVPVEKLRVRLQEILEASPHWDRKVSGIQVTNATDRTVEVRALMSAADSSALWNLRCEVRERLIEYLQREFPESLARLRADLSGPGSLPSSSPAAAPRAGVPRADEPPTDAPPPRGRRDGR
jgi:small-conductance mechanosensitive channel